MKCTRPNYALDLGIKENGARNIKFLPKRADLYSLRQLSARYGKENILPLPCGKCLACKLAHAKEWAVRCTLEALYHEDNYFLTITYDDDHFPENGLLNRRDLTLFLKRLRARCGSFRYFGCGEYGSKTKRPHYHLLLFGLTLNDLQPVGNGLYESKVLKLLWPYGFHYLGSVNYSSANYVAQYTTKKVFKDCSDEFLAASTMPGIGYQWCKDHLGKVLEYDAVFGDFGSSKAVKMPRYFEKMAEVLDSSKYVEVKQKRLDKSTAFQFNEMLIHACEQVEDLNAYKERCLLNDYIAQKKGTRL